MSENRVRVTRASKKRVASAAIVENPPANKKRVVLGELPQLGNVIAPADSKSTTELKKPKRLAKRKVKKAPTSTIAKVITEKDSNAKPDNDSDLDDPQMCGPYASDIYEYLRKMEMEPKRRPLHNYLDKVQKDITPNMRAVLVDWLVEVAEEYKLCSDTLYLSISYIDKFLSVNTLNRQRLQLLGVSSMLIASKYEEISPPHVEDFCYITDNTYTKEEVVKMEADVLKALNFEMGNPTTKTFLRRFISLSQEEYRKYEDLHDANLQLDFLCYYISELSLLDYNCVKFLPSLVAASVMFIANFIILPNGDPWNRVMRRYTGYKASQLKSCVLILHDLYLSRKGGSLQAVREKYKQHKFKCVASLPSPPEVPADYFVDIEAENFCGL